MNKIKKFFSAIGNFFGDFGKAVAKGDIFVKLSLVWMGAGYAGRKQFIKSILMTLVEVGAVLLFVFFSIPNMAKFPTLGTVERATVYDPSTMKNVENDYDNSLMILIYSVISFILILVFVFMWIKNIINAYELQKLKAEGKHINTFKDDMKDLVNDKFHITLLTLPVLGVVIFNIVPIFCLTCIGFTNYDKTHLPPNALFSWVGWTNFKNMFASMDSAFSHAFWRVLIWTFVWAFFATFTTYFGGIFLASFINNIKTKCKKLWRTMFIVTIAVPQFVSLLLVRNFFADKGIVNTLCASIGLTDFLKDIGLVADHLSYIPFLSSPGWAMFMIIMINIWIGIPYQMLIATGILMNIPSDLQESAKIDGANKFQIFRKITMPYMFFVTGPALIADFVKNINNFNVIFLLTNDVYKTTDQLMATANAKEVDLLVTWLFRLTQDYYNYKMASVIGVVVFIICAVFTLIGFNRMIKGDKEGTFQ